MFYKQYSSSSFICLRHDVNPAGRWHAWLETGSGLGNSHVLTRNIRRWNPQVLRCSRRPTDVDPTFTCRWNSPRKVIRYIYHPSRSNMCTAPSSNAINPSESGAHKQRLRGIYANVRSTNALSTPTKNEAFYLVFFIPYEIPRQSEHFSWPSGMTTACCLYIYYTLCLQSLTFRRQSRWKTTCQYLIVGVIWRSSAGISVSSLKYQTGDFCACCYCVVESAFWYWASGIYCCSVMWRSSVISPPSVKEARFSLHISVVVASI